MLIEGLSCIWLEPIELKIEHSKYRVITYAPLIRRIALVYVIIVKNVRNSYNNLLN